MCNCINEVKQMMKETFPNAESISFENVEMLSGRIFSTLEIKLPNKKKPQKQLLLHSICPMCGKAYEDKEEQPNEKKIQ